ncbi:hypothetical protein JCM10296v2_007465 [Rhodotorula toruloides]
MSARTDSDAGTRDDQTGRGKVAVGRRRAEGVTSEAELVKRLDAALSLRGNGATPTQGGRPAALSVAIPSPPLVSAATTGGRSASALGHHPPRPGLHSVHSSFATTHSSRSPASRSTSNTSIHDSVGSAPYVSETTSASYLSGAYGSHQVQHPAQGYPYATPHVHFAHSRQVSSQAWSGAQSPSVSSSPDMVFHGHPGMSAPQGYPPAQAAFYAQYALQQRAPQPMYHQLVYPQTSAVPYTTYSPAAPAPQITYCTVPSPAPAPYAPYYASTAPVPVPTQVLVNHEGNVVYDHDGNAVAYPPPPPPSHPHQAQSQQPYFQPVYVYPQQPPQGVVYPSPPPPQPSQGAPYQPVYFSSPFRAAQLQQQRATPPPPPAQGPSPDAGDSDIVYPISARSSISSPLSTGLPSSLGYTSPAPPAPHPLSPPSRRASFAGSSPSIHLLSPSSHFSPVFPAAGASQVSPLVPRGRGEAYVGRKDLPRPPAHSPHALWVGNVPSDASHAELWQFFQTRPTPRECGITISPNELGVDLESTGVESIHLITRSNCAFVNYVSNLHLHHAIAVTNGTSLRSDDPRCKPLVCRVRKHEDDAKSGVGAQRMGGMHRAFVREQQVRMAERQREIARSEGEEAEGVKGRRMSAGASSIGSTSTTSTFLAKHFERRYFILKSHDEADLRKSVETGVWATQPHNEPVLQQAFRTARSVYLIFSANGSGCWFGYARLSGPVGGAGGSSSRSSRFSFTSSAGERSAELRKSQRSATILEETDESASTPAAAHLFSPSEHRWADQSPSVITPSSAAILDSSTATPVQGGSTGSLAVPVKAGGAEGNSAPASLAVAVPDSAQRAMSRSQDIMALETAENLHLPPDVAAQAKQRRAASFDVAPTKVGDIPRPTAKDEAESPTKGIFAAAAEARNAKLEKMEAAIDESRKSNGSSGTIGAPPAGEENRVGDNRHSSWGTPFAIDWIAVKKLPFSRSRHIRNSFNGNREVKISRDGTELEPTAGELLLNEFWRKDEVAPPSSAGEKVEVPLRPASPQPFFPGAGISALREQDDEGTTPRQVSGMVGAGSASASGSER